MNVLHALVSKSPLDEYWSSGTVEIDIKALQKSLSLSTDVLSTFSRGVLQILGSFVNILHPVVGAGGSLSESGYGTLVKVPRSVAKFLFM